ncbi:hypothetical protein KBY08_00555 [Pseudomonas sp. P135]|uniref:hypothetical protein n=1 Tax=Pseudomonas sp. P135 TaxID=2730420 RepID=UPI001CE2B937|nr:hypothetical protein [Pseudomonas sp. P135]MCA5970205.1 hypothetical protein [Pseudomonas sp. P135]
MNFERKIVITLAAHETALQQIKAQTTEIGVHINLCENGYDKIGPNGIEEHSKDLSDEKGNRKTHIWEAFQHREASSCGYGMVGLHVEEIADFLADEGCIHCIRAWNIILERKKVKQELRGFRLSLRALGKSAIKALMP